MCPGPHQNEGRGWRRETGTDRSNAVLLLWIIYVFVLCVYAFVSHFPFGILCQVWYLIVSIPDLCTLTHLEQGKEVQNWKKSIGVLE